MKELSLNRIKYWMGIAKAVEDSENPCYSRKIGVVIVDPLTDDLVSIGHNGPPKNCPPNDNYQYLQNVVFPLLTAEEISKAKAGIEDNQPDWFSNRYGNCATCPRKIIGAPSGKRLELCSCAHAEHNAVVQAHRSVAGCWMICHCGVPCVECTKTIINSGIKKVVCLKRDSDYSPYSSKWLFREAGVDIMFFDE